MVSDESDTVMLTLEQMLDGGLQVSIPDIQRDFCWGSDHADFDLSRASTFAGGILHLFTKGRCAVLGLVYGYESQKPRGMRYLHIIDGQQRLTTLYLMLGMVYRKAHACNEADAEQIKQLMMRGAQSYADFQPAICYEAKKEVMYFLKDLTWDFFINASGTLSAIEDNDWFFRSYESEPSIQAMLGAITHIEKALEICQIPNFVNLAKFLLSSISFTYYQLPSQEFAERLFITINTTGEPLSLPQKLRSLHLTLRQKPDCGPQLWNEMEDWAWQHRSIAGNDNDACERLLEGIINAHSQMCSMNEDLRKAFDLDSLYAFFKAYTRVAECTGAAPSCFSTMPAVAFVMRFGSDASDAHISDFCNLLENTTRYQRPLANGEDIRQAIAMAWGMPNPSITSLLKYPQASRRLVNEEEREKLLLLSHNPRRHNQLREILRKAESHPLLDGKVATVIKWCSTQKGIDIDLLSQYIDSIYRLWGTDIDKQDSLDNLRKALLALGHKGYPIVRRGDTVLSLCWHDYDWQRLMAIAPGAIKQLLDHSLRQSIDSIIKDFADPSHPYEFIIKDKTNMLSRCRKRQLMRPCTPFIGYYDLELQANVWHIGFAQSIKVDTSRWKPLKPYGSRCLYTDCVVANIAIDLYWQPQERSEYRVEVFARTESTLPGARIKSFVEQYGVLFRYDRKRKRNIAYVRSDHEAAALLQRLMSAFNPLVYVF